MKLYLLSALTLVVFANAQTVTPAGPGNVTLPLDEYNRLTDAANKPQNAPSNAPVPFVIQTADVRLQVTGETATAVIQLEGETFVAGPVKMPLTRGIVVVDAQRIGAPLPLQHENAAEFAVIDGPGPFSITLNAVFPITVDAGRASFQLPAPAAGAVRLTVTLPGDRTNVTIGPGLITSHANDGTHTIVEATLSPGKIASVSWTTHDGGATTVAQPPKEVRFLSDVKTLVTVGESQISLTALADLTVVQGEPAEFSFEIPAGYEITGATGASLASTETKPGVLILKLADPKVRSHQFLIAFERAVDGVKAEVPIPAFRGSQRETGEAAVEGEGALELTAKEAGSLKRMDLKEANPFLIGLAHRPIQAAFRYHRQTGEAAAVNLEWQRFPASAVAAAISDRADATTLVTSDGRTLTEVKLTVRNHAQPFLKVGLPAGATILTAEVGGQPVKPVVAADGNRIPLLRAGFHPAGAYNVSFVFLHAGAPFAKKGGSELELPKMDLPVAVIHWEVFLPDRYKVKDFAGDVVTDIQTQETLYTPAPNTGGQALLDADDAIVINGSSSSALDFDSRAALTPLVPGQLAGIVVDPTGARVPNANVRVFNNDTGQTYQAMSGQDGAWRVAGLTDGRVRVTVNSQGFTGYFGVLNYRQSRPLTLRNQLNVGSTNETVEVTAEAAVVNTETASLSSSRDAKKEKQREKDSEQQASANVVNLQQRVAGVLPIRIDVPRAGRSFRFLRPLVVDETTKVTFTYKSR